MSRPKRILLPLLTAAMLVLPESAVFSKEGVIQCGNLIYARDKTSECFSDEFLRRVEKLTSIRTERIFKSVKLDSEELYNFPFTIMTGEGSFVLSKGERDKLRDYLTRGGFLLASAGCSSKPWDGAFRREVRRIFPNKKLKPIPMTHPIFRTVFKIDRIDLKSAVPGKVLLEGLEIDGKIVMIYSPQGLNDTGHTSGCCCCGGNEVKNSLKINVNVRAYALLH